MSINATFYNFSKRKNSTKIPTGTGDVVAVDLKSGVDLINPSFLIAMSDIPSWNYMQFEGRYYFITDVISVRTELWEITASVDVLGTYKSDILDTSAHVLYYDHNNTQITDTRLSTNTTKTISATSGAFDILGSVGSNNAVVINVVGKESCTSYAINQSDARDLLSNLHNWINTDEDEGGAGFPDISLLSPLDSVVEVLKWIAKQEHFASQQVIASGKVPDCIKSAIMLPLPVSAFAGHDRSIYLGDYLTETIGLEITDRIFSDGCDLTIPWQATDWRRNAPYHELYLYIPYVGIISMSPSDLIGEDNLHVSVCIDVTTGDAIFSVYGNNNNHMIGQYNTNLASNFAIGNSNITPAQAITTLATSGSALAASAMTGGVAGLAIGSVGAGLGISNILVGHPTCIGSNSGGAALGLMSLVKCFSIFHDTTVSPSSVSAIMGTPYNGILSLENITGYVKTSDFSVAGTMTGTEKDLINDMMDGGVYIE